MVSDPDEQRVEAGAGAVPRRDGADRGTVSLCRGRVAAGNGRVVGSDREWLISRWHYYGEENLE